MIILMEYVCARITKSTENFIILLDYIGCILLETFASLFCSFLFQANVTALVVVAEHLGEFEKIMQLSERFDFSLRT